MELWMFKSYFQIQNKKRVHSAAGGKAAVTEVQLVGNSGTITTITLHDHSVLLTAYLYNLVLDCKIYFKFNLSPFIEKGLKLKKLLKKLVFFFNVGSKSNFHKRNA